MSIAAKPRKSRQKSPFRSAGEPFALVAKAEIPLLHRLARLRPSCCTVYLALRMCAGSTGVAFPSQRILADHTGLSKSEVARALVGLREVGVVLRLAGKGKRADRYALRRLDEGPLRDLSGPQLEEAKTRVYGGGQAGGARIRSGVRGPLIQKKQRRKRGVPCALSGNLFDYPPEPIDNDTKVRNRSGPPSEETQAAPAGPPVPAERSAPCGGTPEKLGRGPEPQAAPAGPPARGGPEMRKSDAAVLLKRASVPAGFLPKLLKDAETTRTAVEAAAEALSKNVRNPAGYVLRAVMGRKIDASPRSTGRRALAPSSPAPRLKVLDECRKARIERQVLRGSLFYAHRGTPCELRPCRQCGKHKLLRPVGSPQEEDVCSWCSGVRMIPAQDLPD